MTQKWLDLFLRFSSFIYSLKRRIIGAESWISALPYVFLLLVTELLFLFISLPLYLIVSPKKIQKEPTHLHVYVVRRKISLTMALGAGGILLLKLLFIGVISSYLLGAQALLAATQDWNFSTPTDYTYDSAKITVTSGTAQLKDQGTGNFCDGTASACAAFAATSTCIAQTGCSWGGAASGSTTNLSFDTNTTGWTYADWETAGKVSGARVATGGNPNGYIRITAQSANNTSISGYWQQPFTTTANNPTAVVNFDWKITGYSSAGVSAFNIYVFVDSASGAPTIGNQVWSQTIAGVTSWAHVSNLDVSSKLSATGTHYLKVVAHRVTEAGSKGSDVVGFDNVQLNWSKASSCSGTPMACNTYATSPTCSTQSGCTWNPVPAYPTNRPSIYPISSLAPSGVTSWNSFTETATKNGGEIYYQLSSDDGSTWRYWDGSTWASATTSTNSNTASVVNANIGMFSAAAGKIIWKAFLSSNGAQEVSLDNLTVGYVQNSPPGIQSLSASQNAASGYVNINYTLQDNESDPISLTNYEYSLTGAFAGEQAQMTAATADPAHSGVTGLTSSPTGISHAFIWNALADLSRVYSNMVYVRLRANDGIANSSFATSTTISADYVLPVISNVTASQTPASTNVSIGYNLADDTPSNILVELQISSNDGSTWVVPATSASGDVGASVTIGNGKTIIWLAGTDYPNQEQNNMMVRVRAKDKYQNQTSYVGSASFILDNRAPVVATQTNLLAQPLAGATAVLVGGSFSESNPNTNNFYVALNDGGYGSSAAGDSNTATPSDKNVPTDITLSGHDYISAVKIEITDDFEQMIANENTSPNAAYKYVKPYTPPAPGISDSGESSLDVTINKHLSEADGLEYAVLETTQNLYVQNDGSLSSSPYWRVAGTVTVTGLSQPISQYNFVVKSRNTSDASHAATSESDLSSGASSNYQSPQIAINSVAETTDGTKYVVINYTGTDPQNQSNSFVKHEYSTDGTTWHTMTEKSGVGSAGVSGLAFTTGGASLIFAWDVSTDLPNTEDSSVYVRLESNDTATNSNLATSPAFTVDTAGPVVSNIQATQNPATDNLIIAYDLADSAGINNNVVLAISDDSGTTFNVSAPNVSGDLGTTVTAGLARSISWNVGADLPDQEKNTMKVKLSPTDSYGNQGSQIQSTVFSVDTKVPVISSVSASQASGSALVAVHYNLADASTSTALFNISSNSGSTWDVATTTYTGDMGASLAAGAKLFNWNAVADYPDQESTTMRVRIRATDYYNHQGTYDESSDFSVDTKVLSISNIAAVQNVGARTVAIHYDLNKAATISMDISSDGGTTWDVATTTLSGQIGSGVTAGNNKTIAWNADIDYFNEEKSTIRVRLSGLDGTGSVSPFYESSDFSVDTATPLSLLSLSKFSGTTNSVTMNWSSEIADAHFNRYELWHGTNQNDVINRTGTATKWSTTDDANLSALTTISTVITGINLTSDYFVKIWAVDDYGNEATIADLNVFNPPVQKTLTMSASTGGTTDPTPGAHSYNVDSLVTLTGTPDSGYDFLRWEENGQSIATANPVTITMSTDRAISAIFEATAVTPTPTPTPTPSIATTGGGGGGTSASISNATAPGKPILTPPASPTGLTTVTISGLADPRSRVDLYDNGVLVGRFDSTADNNGIFKQSFIFSTGSHALTARVTDFADNASAPSDSVNLVIVSGAPAAPIVLSPNNNESIADATPTLVGVAAPSAQVEIILDNQYKFTVPTDVDGAWQFKLPSGFALNTGAHTFAAKTIDVVGNASDSARLTVTKTAPTPIATPTRPTPIAPARITPAVPTRTILAPPASLIRNGTEAVQLPGIPVPKVINANAVVANNTFNFSGTSLPNQDVVVYIHSDQALIYRTRTDSQGVWNISHSQDTAELSPGDHTIYAVAVNQAANVKSAPSEVVKFTVKRNFWVMMFKYLNLQTTAVTLVFLFAITVWLYGIRRKEPGR